MLGENQNEPSLGDDEEGLDGTPRTTKGSQEVVSISFFIYSHSSISFIFLHAKILADGLQLSSNLSSSETSP